MLSCDYYASNPNCLPQAVWQVSILLDVSVRPRSADATTHPVCRTDRAERLLALLFLGQRGCSASRLKSYDCAPASTPLFQENHVSVAVRAC
jgi:hypothetical protein